MIKAVVLERYSAKSAKGKEEKQLMSVE